MQWIVSALAVAVTGTLVSGCGSPMLVSAPGAPQVKETQVATDVAGCRAVGNVKSEAAPLDIDTDIRNRTVGLGGNVLFVTSKIGQPSEGVAYRCN
jgi:outer membrane murein-binding lipoprotein Lpp